MQVLGFSDHIPWPDQVPPRDTLHMRMNRAAEYAASVCALREKYRDQIAIYLGFEAEYLPEFYEAQMKMCEELDVDYLIMGQHFLPESLIYAGSRTGSRRVLEQYVDTVLEGFPPAPTPVSAIRISLTLPGMEPFTESRCAGSVKG